MRPDVHSKLTFPGRAGAGADAGWMRHHQGLTRAAPKPRRTTTAQHPGFDFSGAGTRAPRAPAAPGAARGRSAGLTTGAAARARRADFQGQVPNPNTFMGGIKR